jgi:hypothetical protein
MPKCRTDTICDMSANSVKALKLLGVTRWKEFFKFQNQDVVAVYDYLHCLKCTKNLFLKYVVQFESELRHNHLLVTAVWEHISNVYVWDKQNIVHLYYKLTDAYLFLASQYVMKFCLVAQVMNNAI